MMEGVRYSDRPSLDRLKALDTLPDLASQLEEAKQLCVHGARAEMIARWLLDKMKTSEEFRKHSASWECLQMTFRVISPERLAPLLTSHGMLQSIQKALDSAETAQLLLTTTSELLDFLLDLSQSPNAVAIKAALSLPASQAAEFLGHWLQTTFSTISTPGYGVSASSLNTVIRPALQVWDLRKHFPDENECFARHNLRSIAALLTWLSLHRVEHSPKRKLDSSDAEPRMDVKVALESLLARHIFLPGRTAFFRGNEHTTDVLQTMLEPLKPAPTVETEQGDLLLNSLPVLLDIALRSTSTSSPKQRLKEAPWVEAVFDALHEFHQNLDGSVLSRAAPVEMLKAIETRASLPTARLEQLVLFYSGLGDGEDSDDAADWILIAQVISLNRTVFTAEESARQLFSKITGANTCLEDGWTPWTLVLGAKHDLDLTSDALRKVWTESTIVPVMQAMAKGRDLEGFVRLWKEQLGEDEHNRVSSVWTQLERDFSPLLEESLTDDQIMVLFDRHRASIINNLGTESENDSLGTLYGMEADMVILNAVIAGVHSETTTDAMQAAFEPMLEKLFQLHETVKNQEHDSVRAFLAGPQYWSLMRKIFDRFFPHWVARESSMESIGTSVDKLIATAPINAALAISKTVRSGNRKYWYSERAAREAECFVACLFSHFTGCKDYVEETAWLRLFEAAGSLTQRFDAGSMQALIQYPRLLLFVNPGRSDFLASCIMAAANEHFNLEASLSAQEALFATASLAIEAEESSVVEELVVAAMTALKGITGKNGSNRRLEQVVVDLLLLLPATSLSRPQRENILDTVFELQVTSNAVEEDLVQKRFSVMIQLMELPNATSILSTQASALWRLGLSMDVEQYTSYLRNPSQQSKRVNELHEPRTMEMLEQLTGKVLEHLMTTQDQARSQSILHSMSTDAKTMMAGLSRHGTLIDHSAALALIKSTITELEVGMKDNGTQQIAYRETAAHEDFLQWCTTSAAKSFDELAKEVSNVEKIVAETNLHQNLGALQVASTGAPREGSPGRKLSTDRLMRAMGLALNRICVGGVADRNEVDQDKTRAVNAPFIDCYALACGHDWIRGDLDLCVLAMQLMDLSLTATQHRTLLTAFGEYITQLDGTSKLHALGQLLPNNSPAPRSKLLLLQACIERVERKDVDSSKDSIHFQVLHQLSLTGRTTEDVVTRQEAIACMLDLLKSKAFQMNQQGVEEALIVAYDLLQARRAAPLIYSDACKIVSAVLLHHRSRLHGRLHLVVKIFQRLSSRLFQRSKERQRGRRKHNQLSVRHARTLARLLSTLCESPSSRRKANAAELADEARKEQGYVGQFAHYILHHYCNQILNGSMGEGMREALMPGLWSLIEAIEIRHAEGIKSLSAAMNNSERAVLRGIHDEWRRFGKWRGG